MTRGGCAPIHEDNKITWIPTRPRPSNNNPVLLEMRPQAFNLSGLTMYTFLSRSCTNWRMRPTKAATMPNPGSVLRRPQSVGVKTALLGGAKSAMEAYNRISPKGRKISCSLAFISDFSALYCEATSTIKAIITTDNPRALTTMANVLHRPLSP